ncbi:MAG TPA: putative Ig domain-containing protein [Polyangia bacterium]|nr:putative Ig domain-containing protein [Polyangia bacterium]
MAKLSHVLGATVVLAGWSAAPRAAQAAQTNISISMAPAPSKPRIQPPSIVGATPATPFLYAIPATGQAPLAFTASGLPAGLTLDGSSGIVSGTAPAAGSYPVSVTVTNAMGSATATITIASGTTLRPTPPLGWNSYDAFGASITEDEVVQQAQAMRTQLQPYGWNNVIVDYRWYDAEDKIDANGRFLPSPAKYPSATGSLGLKPLSDRVHALGLNFGIHIMRGIPRKAVTANSAIANSTYHAADAANTSDACPWDQHMWGVAGDTAAGQAWYDALFAQYAQWGIDFVKIDDMLNNSTRVYHQAEANAIRSAVNKTGRAIVISFSPGPDDPSWLPSSVSNLNQNAEMWRVVDDFWDYSAITDLAGVFRAAATWQAAAGLVAGHWPDTDMLPLGYLGPRCEWHASGETTLTHNQQVAIMSLWSVFPSPLVFGGNVQSLTTDATSGPWTLALLTNEEVLSVNQDALGAHAKRISQQGSTEVWARNLDGGRKAVALFNNGTADATVSVTFSQLGVTGTPAVRDVWQRADVAGMTTGLSVNVPYGGAVMYTLSPKSTGAGGAGGAGGAAGAGTGGTAGAAGASNVAGHSGSGGAAARGGAAGGGTGGGPIATGGSNASGGAGGSLGTGGIVSPGSGGNASGGATNPPSTGGVPGQGGAPSATAGGSGCSCTVAATPGTTGTGLLLLTLGGLTCRRRRARRPAIT